MVIRRWSTHGCMMPRDGIRLRVTARVLPVTWFLYLKCIWTAGTIPLHATSSQTILILIDDLSVALVAGRRLYTNLSPAMEDSISSGSSREPTPTCEDIYNVTMGGHLQPSHTIAELSQHFDRHSLTPRRPNLAREGSSTTVFRARDHISSLHSTNSFSNRVHRQRQCLQRSSARLSQMTVLVESMVETGLPAYGSLHPASTLEESSTSPSLSPDDQQSSAESYFGLTPLPSFSSLSASAGGAHGSAHHSLRPSRSWKVDKELRHSASRDGIGGQRMVQKKVRMRKSEKNLMKGIGKRKD